VEILQIILLFIDHLLNSELGTMISNHLVIGCAISFPYSTIYTIFAQGLVEGGDPVAWIQQTPVETFAFDFAQENYQIYCTKTPNYADRTNFIPAVSMPCTLGYT
jgi:hypothetical protein